LQILLYPSIYPNEVVKILSHFMQSLFPFVSEDAAVQYLVHVNR